MAFTVSSTSIKGVFELRATTFFDHRGSFSNAFRADDPAILESWKSRNICQVNVSRTEHCGTIRGLHMQAPPFAEAKIVQCLRGQVWDVAVDLRRDSPTYGHWHALKLSSLETNALLIPEGCAHGFQTLERDSEILYLHSGQWAPQAEMGIRWNDPKIAVKWPVEPSRLSERDQALPFLE